MPCVARQWPVTLSRWLWAVLDDGVHLLEGHAQRVMVVGVGRGGVAGGIGLHPFDAVLDELADRAARLVGTVDQQHEAFHADLAKVGIPVHQPADAADLAAAGGQPRAGEQVFLDGPLEPEIDVEQAAAAAGRGIAAVQRQPRVGGRQQRDVLDRVLDVEVFQVGDVEVGGMEVGFDQPRHDRAATSVDPRRFRTDVRSAGGLSGVENAPVANHNGTIGNCRRAGTVNQPSPADPSRATRRFHRVANPAHGPVRGAQLHASCPGVILEQTHPIF